MMVLPLIVIAGRITSHSQTASTKIYLNFACLSSRVFERLPLLTQVAKAVPRAYIGFFASTSAVAFSGSFTFSVCLGPSSNPALRQIS